MKKVFLIIFFGVLAFLSNAQIATHAIDTAGNLLIFQDIASNTKWVMSKTNFYLSANTNSNRDNLGLYLVGKSTALYDGRLSLINVPGATTLVQKFDFLKKHLSFSTGGGVSAPVSSVVGDAKEAKQDVQIGKQDAQIMRAQYALDSLGKTILELHRIAGKAQWKGDSIATFAQGQSVAKEAKQNNQLDSAKVANALIRQVKNAQVVFKNSFDARDLATNSILVTAKNDIVSVLQDKATAQNQVNVRDAVVDQTGYVINQTNSILANVANQTKQDAQLAKEEDIRIAVESVNTSLDGLSNLDPSATLTTASVATATNTATTATNTGATNTILTDANTKIDAGNVILTSLDSKINDVSTATNQTAQTTELVAVNTRLTEISNEIVKPPSYSTPNRTMQVLQAGGGIIDIDGSSIRQWTITNIGADHGGKLILISYDAGSNWTIIEPGQTWSETQSINPIDKRITEPSNVKIDVLDSAWVTITTLQK